MILRFRNYSSFSTTLWVPLETFGETPNFNWASYVLIAVFMILMAFCAYSIVILIRIMWRIKKIHTNNRIILSVLITSWFSCVFGYLALLPYQYNIIELEDHTSFLGGFETESNMIVDLNLKTIPLLIGSILMWTYFSTVLASLIVFLIERSLATYLYRDYEKKPRPCLAILLVALLITLIILQAFLLTTYIVTMKSSLIIAVIVVAFFIPSFAYLKFYNNRLRNHLKMGQSNMNTIPNVLAAKFQAEENIRSLNLATNFVYSSMIIEAIFLLVLIATVLNVIESKTSFFLFQIICLLNPLVIVPATLSSVVEWRNAFIREVPFVPRTMRTTKIYVRSQNAESITTVYFQQLNVSWGR